jgi:L-ascorbate metabolism protein UlaG (beta-lactamase superfamily)
MPSSTKSQVAGIGVILIVVVAVSGYFLLPNILNPSPEREMVTVHLCDTVCVIIEYNGTRIVIDPWYFLENYTGLLADVVLITHSHYDHYNATTIDSIQKEDTMNILPAQMYAEVAYHDGIGVVPGDVIHFGNITITAFYMYTPDYAHPRFYNWTSYLIDINGFTIFHGGDATNMSEYTQLNGLVDVAFLPTYTFDNTTVHIIEMMQPRYFVPTHFYAQYSDYWFNNYGDQVPLVSDSEIIRMNYWTSHTFEI